ncbi:DUF6233 domain-containing protein [Streptomyces sp. NPDC056723]|uniref:DUF6233 domain-containing protein n=1 Tax=Streptomyces sp. NPDC056723 TaxID=3345925 RepID=UPI00368F6017
MPELPPPIRVLLPDGEQELRGRLYERRQTKHGWRYWVGLPLWQNVDEDGAVAPGEYRVWLSNEEAVPLDGVSYEAVPTHRLAPVPEPEMRWAWSLQRLQGKNGRVGGNVVHDYDCPDSPRGATELNLDQALDALQRPGTQACKECGAAVVLLPLLGRSEASED